MAGAGHRLASFKPCYAWPTCPPYALLAPTEGRQLVYELAGRYKNSLLLNFAIHKILMQPGREKEVRGLG